MSMTKWLPCCLLLFACTPTEPEMSPCPDGMEAWQWSYMDDAGVVHNKDLCFPAGTADGMFNIGQEPETGGIILIICYDGVCPDLRGENYLEIKGWDDGR